MHRAISKTLRSAFAALVLLTTFATLQTASAEKYAALVVDADTNEVLHARHADDPRYPASLTKVMTLYMLFDALKSGEVTLNERLPVSRFAASQAPSNLRLKAGSSIRTKDAIDALVTKSANDVAVVVAERLGGSEERFARLMTAKAKSMGMTNTRFKNASGLPDSQQLTTARDLAVLAEAVMTDHADYYHYFSREKFSWGKKTYKNHNELLKTVPGVNGIKTGYTRASGFNLMTAAERDGHRIIAIMLGGHTSKSRDAHVTELVEAAFASYDAPANTTRLASFDEIRAPLHPDAAAEPMINGKRLSVIIAEGDKDESGDTLEVIEASSAPAPEPAPALTQAVEPAPVLAVPPPKDGKKAAPPMPEPSPRMTFSEYELRQMGLAN